MFHQAQHWLAKICALEDLAGKPSQPPFKKSQSISETISVTVQAL